MKVCIVSPDRETHTLLRRILAANDIQFEHGLEAQDVVEHCRASTSLVIYDAAFGQAITLEILRTLNEQVEHPRLLALINPGDVELIDTMLKLGATDVILKPLIPALVRQRVRWILRAFHAADLHSALRKSEARIHTIINNAAIVLFAYGNNGQITFVSGKGLERATRSAQELIGRSMFSLSNQHIVKAARHVLETGQPYNTTVEDGGRFFETWYNPVLGPDGSIQEVIGIAADVTPRVSAEQNLERSLNFYLTLFEDFPLPIWRSGTNARLNFLNQSWLDYTGKTIEKALQLNWLDDIHSDDRQEWREKYLHYFRRRDPFEIEYRMRRADGEYRRVVNIGSPFTELDGSFGGYIGMIYDITARKHAEVAQVELNVERERVKMLQEFISTVSHDLKTPLSGIILYANLLRQTNTPEQRQRYSQIVEEQSDQLRRLLDNMLDMSRLEEEITTLTFQMTNIASVIQATVEFYRAEAQRKGLKLISEIADDMPRLMANSYELRRSMGNLVDNAIKYTNEGSVSIRAFSQHKHVVVEIEDTGQGVAEDDLPFIFDRFYRADKSRSFTGTGLGLTIVKKIIEAHGGTVHVYSQLGEGSKFRIELPTLGHILSEANQLESKHN